MKKIPGNLGHNAYSMDYLLSNYFGEQRKKNIDIEPPRAVFSNIKELDDVPVNFKPGDLSVFAGVPHCTKRFLVNSLILGFSQKSPCFPERNQHVICLSLVRDAFEVFSGIIATHTNEMSFGLNRGMNDDIGELKQHLIREDLNCRQIQIDDTRYGKVSMLLQQVRYYAQRFPESVIIIDELQNIEECKTSRTATSICLEQLKCIAAELTVTILLFSEVSERVEKRPNRKPKIKDLQDLGDFKNVADNIFMIYNKGYYGLHESSPIVEGTENLYLFLKRKKKHRKDVEIIIPYDRFLGLQPNHNGVPKLK